MNEWHNNRKSIEERQKNRPQQKEQATTKSQASNMVLFKGTAKLHWKTLVSGVYRELDL